MCTNDQLIFLLYIDTLGYSAPKAVTFVWFRARNSNILRYMQSMLGCRCFEYFRY